MRELAARDGFVLRLVEFTDFIQPNAALASGDLDSNSYQHRPFLEQQIRDRGYKLAAVARTLVFPLGIYAPKYKALSDLPQGGRVAIPNDPSNGGRALLLLAKAGLIRLAPGADFRATVADIAENPKRLRIVELEAAQMPRALGDVDAAVVITDYALIAGLDPAKDALLREDADSPYANILVVREADRDTPWVKRWWPPITATRSAPSCAIPSTAMSCRPSEEHPMNRRPLLLATAGGLFLPGILRAQDAAGIGTAARPCRVGVTSGVHAQVLEQVRDVLARDNFVVRITEFGDFIQPNVALAGGDIDANTYQHQPFLDAQKAQRGYDFVRWARPC